MTITVPDMSRRWLAFATITGVTIGYTAAVDPVVYSIEQVVYPVVWIAASGAALWLVPDYRWRVLGAGPLVLGGAYTLVLLWTAGLVGSPAGAPGLTVHLSLPGWGPTVVYTTQWLTVSLVPFLVAGYLTLGVLAAVAVQQSWGAAGPGLVGLFACVSCTAPLLSAVAGSLGAGSVAASLSSAQYPLATGAFLLSVGALVVITRRSAPACDLPAG